MQGTITSVAPVRTVRPLAQYKALRYWASQYKGWITRIGLLGLCLLATAQFVGAYLFLEYPYVDIHRFEHGYERLPFQTRLLTAPLYSWVDRSPAFIAYASRLSRNTYFFPHGIYPGEVLEFFMGIGCVLFAGWVATRIYAAASRRHLLTPFVYPLFLILCVAAYILHTVQNFRYPYDMPSLAFFAAGFYLIYFRKPVLWFVALFTVATLNRETVLLLLPFFALSRANDEGHFRWRVLIQPSTLAVVLPLMLYWAAWHHMIFAVFAHNASEYYSRIPFNLRCFARLRYYPQLFSSIGFLTPFLFLGRRFVADRQLRLWLWAIPVWFGFMFTWGILVETRIYGELLPFITAYTAIMGEEWIAARMRVGGVRSENAERTSFVARRAA